MNTIWTTLLVWLGWNILAPLLFALVVLVVFGLCCIPSMIRRALCKHRNYYENMACDAICSDCRKNLGFIDNVRDKQEHYK